MSLSRALTRLSDDEHTAHVLRDVLTLFGHHEREWLTESEVRTKTGRSQSDIRDVLPVLSDSFVLDYDRAADTYRFSGDVVLGFEIDSFMRQVDCHQSHVRTNVARFRERHSY